MFVLEEEWRPGNVSVKRYGLSRRVGREREVVERRVFRRVSTERTGGSISSGQIVKKISVSEREVGSSSRHRTSVE